MKKKFSIIFLVLFLSGCGEEQFIGSENIISITRELDAFTAIEANNALRVNISQASIQQIEVIANDNLQRRIQTQVTDGRLVISLDAGSFQNATLIVNVQVPDLEQVQLNDATLANISMVTDQLDLVVKDASNVTLEGAVDVLNVNVDNAAMINGFSHTARVVNVTAKGASRLEITSQDELNGVVRDAARVLYKGNPDITITSSDAGRIINAN